MNDLYQIDFNHPHFRWASDLPEWLAPIKGAAYQLEVGRTILFDESDMIVTNYEGDVIGRLVEVGEEQG